MEGWQRAFVLHSRPWSETSLMLDVFTEESGRVRLVAKGARSKRSTLKGAFTAFHPLSCYVSAGVAKSKRCAVLKLSRCAAIKRYHALQRSVHQRTSLPRTGIRDALL
ncbi:DNA repair protein [Escherichia coli]|uniref:DNA repair protein n=1 Tax=Escherichia coli TaxID=562 RepID=A0A376KQY5_ECOLX|nr:DNA repair protein [Escherichia coli]